MGGFNFPVNIDFDIVKSPKDIFPVVVVVFNFAFGVVCDMQDLYSLIPCQNSILLFRPLFSRLGHTHSFIW
jgi:hypothetical protein